MEKWRKLGALIAFGVVKFLNPQNPLGGRLRQPTVARSNQVSRHGRECTAEPAPVAIELVRAHVYAAFAGLVLSALLSGAKWLLLPRHN